jgi:mono/diheme cytochrome c family protein
LKTIAFCSLFFVGAMGTALAADASAGKAVYAKRCQSCHGAKGEGNPNVAKMLKATMKPLSDSSVQSKSDDDLKKDIANGVGKMKPVKLTDAEASDVVAYVKTLK